MRDCIPESMAQLSGGAQRFDATLQAGAFKIYKVLHDSSPAFEYILT